MLLTSSDTIQNVKCAGQGGRCPLAGRGAEPHFDWAGFILAYGPFKARGLFFCGLGTGGSRKVMRPTPSGVTSMR